MPSGVYPKSKEYLKRLKEQGFQKGNKMNQGINNPMYGKMGNKAAHWKGGIMKHKFGYILIYKPEHPFCKNNYVFEHHLVMEKHIGRYLNPEEVVHHRNRKVSDNRIKNLQLFPNHSAHLSSHWSNPIYRKHQSNIHKKYHLK